MRLRPAYTSGYDVPIGVYPSLGERGDYASERYGNARVNLKEAYKGLERTANWFFDRKHPYKAAGLLGGLGGFAAGAAMFAGLGPVGLLGMLFTGLVGVTATTIPAAGYHWLWGREGQNKEVLNGMSIGKRLREYIRTGK